MTNVKPNDCDMAGASSSDAGLLLYVNGCSMTYGYELIDESKRHTCYDKAYREAHAWPGCLAARLECGQMINDSVPGGSNDRILRTTIRWVLDFLRAVGERGRQRLIVVIGWTDPMRREYFIDGEWKQAIPYQDYPDHPEFSRLNNVYREVAWNDHESACRFAMQVLAMQAFLQNYGIRFLFFDALKSCQETFAVARDDLDHVNAVDPRTYYRFGECGGSMASTLALGNRSLLADPRGAKIKEMVNDIKRREPFRPFAPAILSEHAATYFDIPDVASPYMQFTAHCRDPGRFPAICHVDGSSRVQTVSAAQNPSFHRLLNKFYRHTGCPMLLNTSLNVKGKPIVNDWDDATAFTRETGIRVF